MSRCEVESLLGRGVPELYDDREGMNTPTSSSEMVEAAFEGTAMGWSWAVHFCNESIADRMHTAFAQSGLSPVLLGDCQAPPRFNHAAPVMAPYADNAYMLAMHEPTGNAEFERLDADLHRKGFVLRDRIAGSSPFEFLGMRLDGEEGVLRHREQQTWRLWIWRRHGGVGGPPLPSLRLGDAPAQHAPLVLHILAPQLGPGSAVDVP